jgi:hypothetical protein
MAPTPAPFTSIALYDLNDSTTAFPLVVAAGKRTTVRLAALILVPRIHLPRIRIVPIALHAIRIHCRSPTHPKQAARSKAASS